MRNFNVDKKKILMTLVVVSVVFLLSSYVFDKVQQSIIDDINRSYMRMCDASYLVGSDDVNSPTYVDSYLELKAKIKKHPDLFKQEYDAHVMVEVLIASDVVEQTEYLSDLRCRYNIEYTKAYFGIYQDEFERLKEAYFEEIGVFHPRYIKY